MAIRVQDPFMCTRKTFLFILDRQENTPVESNMLETFLNTGGYEGDDMVEAFKTNIRDKKSFTEFMGK
jgi:hypothetical protein